MKRSRSEKLQKRLAKTIPGITFIEDFCWAGAFGETKDGLPYIGRTDEYKNALFVLAFGGNGIVFSVQAMQIISDLIENKKNDLAYYYRFGR